MQAPIFTVWWNRQKANGLDPFDYLAWLFTVLPITPKEKLRDLLPHVVDPAIVNGFVARNALNLTVLNNRLRQKPQNGAKQSLTTSMLLEFALFYLISECPEVDVMRLAIFPLAFSPILDMRILFTLQNAFAHFSLPWMKEYQYPARNLPVGIF
jgi:hypothetical protein